MTSDPIPGDDPVRAQLTDLATNLRWAWHRPTRTLLRELAGDDWETCGRNPLAVVRALSDDRLGELADDPAWRERTAGLHEDLERYVGTSTAPHGHTAGRIAYFSAEFALADGFATYSGGLGVLAGDHLRSASDLGVPLVAVGLAYHQGYFRQTIDGEGRQHAHPATNDFGALPATPVTDPAGERIVVTVPMGDGALAARAWRVDVGRVPLFLLDTDVDGNEPHQRAVTGQLYGGDRDMRIRQELVLGVGGVRLLDGLGIAPAGLHLNEGHAAFAGLARYVDHRRQGASHHEAVARVRDELVFTTHTPVPAGHDTFDEGLARYHLGPLLESIGGFGDVAGLATDGHDPRWNQTVLALRLAGRTNGVARLHGEVSRAMFAGLWPDRPVEEVPIGHVTNGVHPRTWVGAEVATILDEHTPRWDAPGSGLDGLRHVDPAVLWRAHVAARHRLLAAVRDRLDRQAAREHGAVDGHGLDPDALTIGFARRFATYKRGTLLAHDLGRLEQLLGDARRPLQIVVAGKAHPADTEAQQLITDLVELSRHPGLGGRLVVVEGYDLELAELLVGGCDVWLNTPLRPMEASGTSGMKAAMNGCLNVSVLDGWWDEAVTDLMGEADVGIGWVIGDGHVYDDRAAQDARDADSLYHVLAEQVVPRFHERDAHDVPRHWVAMMIDAIRLITPRFSSHRMVEDYVALYSGDDRR